MESPSTGRLAAGFGKNLVGLTLILKSFWGVCNLSNFFSCRGAGATLSRRSDLISTGEALSGCCASITFSKERYSRSDMEFRPPVAILSAICMSNMSVKISLPIPPENNPSFLADASGTVSLMVFRSWYMKNASNSLVALWRRTFSPSRLAGFSSFSFSTLEREGTERLDVTAFIAITGLSTPI